MYRFFRFFVFQLSAETAHSFTTNLLHFALYLPFSNWFFRKLFCVENPKLKRNVFGLTFKNPIGLAAGFDKNAEHYQQMGLCGFGFIEIGTVTPLAQPGNDQPRLFRLIEDEAIINRMGFNNKGVEEVIKNLKDRNKSDGLIVGGNIGKNKITPNENAIEDYILALNALHPFVDYFVVNVSSPNTPNLRELQEKEPLKELLNAVKKANSLFQIQRPILLKIAPDLSDSQLDDIIEIMQETNLDGLVATNTTIDRGGLKTKKESVDNIGAGGLSGKPLAQRSTEVIRYLHKHSKGSFPIIGVGGIHSVEDALEKLEAGAQLLQIYTGFIYEGPALIAKINRAIIEHSK